MSDRELIEAASEDGSLLTDAADAVRRVMAALDTGELRVAEKVDGEWIVHEWVKQGILLYFGITETVTIEAGDLRFRDKLPIKQDYAAQGLRVVPPGIVRYGAYCEPGVIVMPGFVNIGARVGSGTMVDTWATVGSCAQIGAGVHLSGGVGIGGVLEPLNARPVIIEDGAFIGSRAIVTEGTIVEERAVLAANVCLTASTPIIDLTTEERREYRGHVPAGAVVVPGTRPKEMPGGTAHLACAYILGMRSDSTGERTSLAQALREYDISV